MPTNMDIAAIASEGQQVFTCEGSARAGGGLKARHKAGIALLQQTGQGAEVLLVHQANGRWSLPIGKRKKGESIKQTGLRECREETGHEARALQFVGWGINSRKHVRFYLWKSEAAVRKRESAMILQLIQHHEALRAPQTVHP
jgi:ADP-ribose pyrophosphatase YjhB (NUDIX family)